MPPSTSDHPLPQGLLIQRAPNKNHPWSAHIAFPGGPRDACDASDLDTAVREDWEELGLCLSDASTYSLLERLIDRPIIRDRSRLNATLCAFVFYQIAGASPQPLALQPEEVASAFWASLSDMHAHSPAVCSHVTTPSPATARLSPHPLCRLLRMVSHLLGVTTLQMPAIDVLPLATDKVCSATGHTAPPVVLWGLTLSCVGDLVSALDLRRVDWPAVLPSNRLLAACVWALAQLYYLVSITPLLLRGWSPRTGCNITNMVDS